MARGHDTWLEGPMHLYFTDRDHAITSGASNWSMDDEIYYDMDILPEARVLAAAYTPKPVGARDANALKRAEALTGGGKTREHLRHPAADVDLRTDRGGRRHAVPRVCLHPRPPLRELQPAELPGAAPARHCLGRQAIERRRTPAARRDRRRLALRRRRTHASRQGRGDDRGPSGVRSVARGGRTADPEGDESRLGRARPALGLRNARVSERPACPDCRVVERQRIARVVRRDTRPGGHHFDPVGHERRWPDGPEARLCRQARARDRLRAASIGRDRRDGARHLVSRGHER